MSTVKIEAFMSTPACSGCVSLSSVLDEIKEELGDSIEIVIYESHHNLFEEYNLTEAPAVVVGEMVKIMGFCPSKETLVSALREAGMNT